MKETTILSLVFITGLTTGLLVLKDEPQELTLNEVKVNERQYTYDKDKQDMLLLRCISLYDYSKASKYSKLKFCERLIAAGSFK